MILFILFSLRLINIVDVWDGCIFFGKLRFPTFLLKATVQTSFWWAIFSFEWRLNSTWILMIRILLLRAFLDNILVLFLDFIVLLLESQKYVVSYYSTIRHEFINISFWWLSKLLNFKRLVIFGEYSRNRWNFTNVANQKVSLRVQEANSRNRFRKFDFSDQLLFDIPNFN